MVNNKVNRIVKRDFVVSMTLMASINCDAAKITNIIRLSDQGIRCTPCAKADSRPWTWVFTIIAGNKVVPMEIVDSFLQWVVGWFELGRRRWVPKAHNMVEVKKNWWNLNKEHE